MSYTVTGTAGNDTLNQAVDVGPGTIVGLAGSDLISTGTGAVTVDGGSGEDIVVLQAGNTGQVTGGTENDSIWDQDANIGSMILFGNEGADTIKIDNSTSAQTILGGNDSADGNDSIRSGSGPDLVFGHGGDDRLFAGRGNDTYVAGFGNDYVEDPTNGANDLVFGNEGNDTINVYDGNDTGFGGQGNDWVILLASDSALYFLNEGNDTVAGGMATAALTIVGGNDSADGSDSIFTGTGADLVFGNGGNDTIRDVGGGNTLIGGVGNDSLQCTTDGTDLIFANEGDDTVGSASGQDTVFGGQGNDQITGGFDGGQLLMGNEGNDTLWGLMGIDTLSGGSGADVFRYFDADEDGNNSPGGGPLEQVTDVNFAEDRFLLPWHVDFAAQTSAGAAANLTQAAENALAAAWALNGSVNARTAAQFEFNGRTYLVADSSFVGFFSENNDLLIDITGATGTISTGSFLG